MQWYRHRNSRKDRIVHVRGAVAWIAALAAVGIHVEVARATWSLILIDLRTQEIAVGSATCVPDSDLETTVPVIIPGVAAACAQSLVDTTGENKAFIWEQLQQSRRPQRILDELALLDDQHQRRQYGFATVSARTLGFSGGLTGDYAGDVTGVIPASSEDEGDIVYAIQGNLLAGAPVIDQIEAAINETSGDLPEKLMAAMEAARAFGGDGRCSCSFADADGCGSPPSEPFDKSAIIGFMISAREGDSLGVCEPPPIGCARGSYFMNLNVANLGFESPAPIPLLREAFDQFRLSEVGRPDAVRSTVTINNGGVPFANRNDAAELIIDLRDWQGTPIEETVFVTLSRAAGSDNVTVLGPVERLKDGTYRTTLQRTGDVGRDELNIFAEDGGRAVILMPRPTIATFPLADATSDIYVDLADCANYASCIESGGPNMETPPGCPDPTANGSTDLRDFAVLQRDLTGPPCGELSVNVQPENVFARCGRSFQMSASFYADPAPTYQWFRNGAPIDGATSQVLSDPGAGNASAGEYFLRATSVCGTRDTAPATVELVNGPCP